MELIKLYIFSVCVHRATPLVPLRNLRCTFGALHRFSLFFSLPSYGRSWLVVVLRSWRCLFENCTHTHTHTITQECTRRRVRVSESLLLENLFAHKPSYNSHEISVWILSIHWTDSPIWRNDINIITKCLPLNIDYSGAHIFSNSFSLRRNLSRVWFAGGVELETWPIWESCWRRRSAFIEKNVRGGSTNRKNVVGGILSNRLQRHRQQEFAAPHQRKASRQDDGREREWINKFNVPSCVQVHCKWAHHSNGITDAIGHCHFPIKSITL